MGLAGFKDAISSVYPLSDIHRCIIHQICTSTKYVTTKDIKSFMRDLKKIYKATIQEEAWDNLLEFESAWGARGILSASRAGRRTGTSLLTSSPSL